MRITMLGQLAVDERPVRGERLAAVIRALVTARGRAVSTATLVEAVWGGTPPEDAVGAVQALIARTRRLGLPVVAVPSGYRLPADQVAVDAVVAGEHLERARGALLAGDVEAARTGALAARAMLPEVPDLFDAQQARLLAGAAALLAEAALALGGPFDETDLRMLVAHVPPDEPSAALLVKVLAAQGRQAEAIEVVERLRAELAERYGTDPAPAVAEVHVALLRGELAMAPAMARPGKAGQGQPRDGHRRDGQQRDGQQRDDGQARDDRRRDDQQRGDGQAQDDQQRGDQVRGGGQSRQNGRATVVLPAAWRRPGTAMLGREPDVMAVTGALDHAQLVTVVATGGTGKTRLAAEIARRTVAAGRSVRVVELAGLRSPDEVLPALVAVVGDLDHGTGRTDMVSQRRAIRPADRLRLTVSDLDGLLVIDNCEHLLDAAAAAVAEVLAVASPELQVLATSRAPLSLVGESVHRLLALPDEDALGLLEARAKAGSAVLPADPSHALALCNRLDNLPLALELAAARLRNMPIEDVLAGLDDRFGLLDDALRGLPERHASLWAMVDWSYELLSPGERALLPRLSVIPAPFTVEAAARVAGAEHVRRGLAALVEQSLLSLEEGDDGRPRYRMLETVREYGGARLDAADEARADQLPAAPGDQRAAARSGQRSTAPVDQGSQREAAMAGLVEWARALAVELLAGFVGRGQLAAFTRCAAEQDNLVAALRWALAARDEAAVVDLAAALFQFWTVRGLHHEVVVWAGAVFHLDDPVARRDSVILRGAAAGRPVPDADRLGWMCLFLGANAGIAGAYRLLAMTNRALRALLDRRAGEIGARTAALLPLVPMLLTPDPEHGLLAAAGMVADPDPYVQAFGLLLRATMRENRGLTRDSAQDAVAAYHQFESIGDHWGMAMSAQGMGELLGSRAEAGAQEWLHRGERHLELIGATQDVWSIRLRLDIQRAMAGDPEAAGRLLDAATSGEGRAMDAVQAQLGLAQLACLQGRYKETLRFVDSALEATGRPGPGMPQVRVVVRIAAAILHLTVAEGGPVPGSVAGSGSGVYQPGEHGTAPAPDRAAATAAVLLSSIRDDALSSFDVPVLGSWATGGAALAAHRCDAGTARELWVLGERLGANIGYLFQQGYGERLAAVLEDEASREPLVAEWLRRSSAETTTRICELMDRLLGSDRLPG